MRNKKQYINIEIDKLTKSIENAITGDKFDTEILKITKSDYKNIKTGWNFDWIKETNKNEVYKLVIINNPGVIQGLISIIDGRDHILINLIESAHFNIGQNKTYKGVAGNLFAFACKISFDRDYNGYVAFVSKTQLVQHYKRTLGAQQIGNSIRLFIDTKAALKLVQLYYN